MASRIQIHPALPRVPTHPPSCRAEVRTEYGVKMFFDLAAVQGKQGPTRGFAKKVRGLFVNSGQGPPLCCSAFQPHWNDWPRGLSAAGPSLAYSTSTHTAVSQSEWEWTLM